MQRTRATLLIVVIALVASMLTLFARTPDASACSVAPPMLEVWPADALEPGQPLKVQGYGFSDMVFHPWEEEYDADGNPIPQHSCAGIEIVPMEVTLSWIGERTEHLATVKGPDFAIEVTVPKWATPGPAIIDANGFETYVHVGGPEPCPAHATTDERLTQVWPPECPDPCLGGPAIDVWCPEPCLYEQPAIDPWCPEPCPLYAAGDEPLVQVWPPECPDPCLGGPAIDVWCPEPCLYEQPAIDVWCPEPCPPTILNDAGYCPEPCPLITIDYADRTDASDADGTHAVSPAGCPDPCWGAADILCPIPEPIPLPEPLPEPRPEPVPEPHPVPLPEPWPRPIPCLLQPDGTIICPAVLPAFEAPSGAASGMAAATASLPASAPDASADSAVQPVTVPAPPRPFIDFDGCRLDGADACT